MNTTVETILKTLSSLDKFVHNGKAIAITYIEDEVDNRNGKIYINHNCVLKSDFDYMVGQESVGNISHFAVLRVIEQLSKEDKE